ncbi:MAG: insulinase family protein [Muribaculaceae bacterium]|nr:insulinase family protein [Muribaculaceae bacterium]
MKRNFFKTMLAVMMTVTSCLVMSAQMQPVPADPAVRIGKLDNGLTYYIRHNETPKGQADFFIAQSVGSILENDDQRGLAHFLEHMCFNGTENFPGNSLIDWLETVGVKFGQNLNAYTGMDETVYNISSVPVDRTGVQDSCLLILHDWADGLLLDPEEIDKERGVIHQEWRRSNVGSMRILEEIAPKIYPNNPYGERLPIGTMEVVDNFPPQVLRDYYETWYRPDNQAVIVVGDIDPDYIESKIKEIFSPIKMPENAPVRFRPEVADNQGTIYAIGKDKEQNEPDLILAFKQSERILPDEMKSTMMYYPVHYMTNMVNRMLNDRINEIAKQPDASFSKGNAYIGEFLFSPTKDAFMIDVTAKGNETLTALKDVYAEALRAARYGFTVTEYERAKADYLSSMERLYNQREKTQNTSYAREYARNFTQKEPAPGIEFEYQMAQQLTQMIPLEAINALLPELLASQDNRVVIGMFPDNDTFSIPTEEQIAQTIADTENLELEAYKDEMKDTPLIPELPTPVKAEKTSVNEANGVTTLVYPNGLTVKVKPTDFKSNQIVFEGIAKGGLSVTSPEDAESVLFIPYAMSNHGFGDYTNTDMKKYLNGKQVSLDISFDAYTTDMSGETTPKDLSTLMELIYMAFKDITITEDDFATTKNRLTTQLANQEKDPNFVFSKELLHSLYKSQAMQLPTTETLDKVNRETILNIVHEMMAHPGRFTLVFVGDIDMETFVPLADQYLGSLTAPRSMPVQYVINPDFEFTKGDSKIETTTQMQTPQTYVAVTASANMPYTAKSKLETSMAGQILSNRLLKKIREEMGAVYSIGAGSRMDRVSDQNVILQIPFPMDPAQREAVLAEIANILNDMATSVSAEELDPIKEYMVKNAKESIVKNEDWAGFLAAETLNGVDTFTNTVETVQSITPEDISAFMKQLINAGNLRYFILDPAE